MWGAGVSNDWCFTVYFLFSAIAGTTFFLKGRWIQKHSVARTDFWSTCFLSFQTMNYLKLVDIGYPVDTFKLLFNVKLKMAFFATQDESEAMKVQALTTVCAGEWSSIISQPIFYLFPIVKLSYFAILNYMTTTFFNLASSFSLKNCFQFWGLWVPPVKLPASDFKCQIDNREDAISDLVVNNFSSNA